MDNTCILVGTYDKNEYIWKILCYSIRKYWPDRPWDIKAVTNNKDFPCGEGLKIGGDKIWGRNVKRSLEKVEEDIIIFMNDDSWLTGPVKTQEIRDFIDIIDEGKADHIRLLNTKNVSGTDAIIDNRLKKFNKKSKYRASVCNGIWRKEVMYDLLDGVESCWEFEKKGGSEKSRNYDTFYYTKKNDYMPHVVPACGWKWTPIQKGKMTNSGKKWLEIEGTVSI